MQLALRLPVRGGKRRRRAEAQGNTSIGQPPSSRALSRPDARACDTAGRGLHTIPPQLAPVRADQGMLCALARPVRGAACRIHRAWQSPSSDRRGGRFGLALARRSGALHPAGASSQCLARAAWPRIRGPLPFAALAHAHGALWRHPIHPPQRRASLRRGRDRRILVRRERRQPLRRFAPRMARRGRLAASAQCDRAGIVRG